MKNKDVWRALNISYHTMRKHRANIFKKLNANGKYVAIEIAKQNNWWGYLESLKRMWVEKIKSNFFYLLPANEPPKPLAEKMLFAFFIQEAKIFFICQKHPLTPVVIKLCSHNKICLWNCSFRLWNITFCRKA